MRIANNPTIIKRLAGEAVTLDTRADAEACVDKQKRYAQIIECMKDSDEPMSAKAIAVEMYRRHYIPTTERNFTAPRLTEMSKTGIVEPVGKVKRPFTGRMVAVYGLLK